MMILMMMYLIDRRRNRRWSKNHSPFWMVWLWTLVLTLSSFSAITHGFLQPSTTTTLTKGERWQLTGRTGDVIILRGPTILGASTATDGTETEGTGGSISKEDLTTKTLASTEEGHRSSISLQSLSNPSVKIRKNIKNDKGSRSYKGGIGSHVNATTTASLSSSKSKQKNTPSSKQNHHQQKKKKKLLSNEEKEFQWLNWLYCQWSKYDVGTIPLSVLKQMEPAISTWARRAPLSATNRSKNKNITTSDPHTYNAERAEELLDRIIEEYLAGNPNVVADVTDNDETTKPATPAADDGADDGDDGGIKASVNTATSNGSGKLRLRVSLFNSAMDAYAKIGNPEGVQRLLRRMNELRQSKPIVSATSTSSSSTSQLLPLSYLQPNVFSMSTLATAWTKSQSPDAALQAQAILRYMEQRKIVPNAITYNSVLHAIVTSPATTSSSSSTTGRRRSRASHMASSSLDKVKRVQDLIQHMKQQHEDQMKENPSSASPSNSTTAENKDIMDCAPDVYSYQMLLLAWSKAAIHYIPPMPDTNFSPQISFSSSSLRTKTIKDTSLATEESSISGTPQENVERIIGYLEKEARNDPNSRCAANVHCYTAAVQTYTNSKTQRQKARHAYSLLQRLRQLYESTGKKDAMPNVVLYTAVLNACARPVDDYEKQESYDIAVLTMEEILLLSKASSADGSRRRRQRGSTVQNQKELVSPNFLTFAAFLGVCSYTLLPSSQRDDIVERTFQQCCEYGQCGQIVLEKLKQAASPTLYQTLLGEYLQPSDGEENYYHASTGVLNTQALPRAWTRHIRGERLKPGNQ